jgi:hypothetical protein
MLPLRRRILLLGFALAPLTIVFACEKVPLLAPTGSTITLTTTATALSANGTAPVVAQVLEASGFPPHSGTHVTFVTTLGQLQPSEGETDVNGQVSSTFAAGGSNGTATITALSGGATTGPAGALKIFVGTAAVGRVSVNANPLTVPASGGSSTITALVLDINGNPLVGSPVTFTTTAGTLAAGASLTNGNGVASSVLTTSVQATVTATVGATAPTTPPATGTTPPVATGQASGAVTITVQSAPTITITPPAAIQKNIPATFTITVTAAAANGSPIKDVTVNWGDGQAQSLGAFTGAQPATHRYESNGTFVVSATVTDVAGNSTTVSSPVVVTPLPGTSVVVNFSSTPNPPVVGTPVTFSMTITPPTGVGIVSSSIDYGDGQVDQLGAAASATKTHSYSSAGPKNVVVTAIDTAGRSTPGTTVVVVN